MSFLALANVEIAANHTQSWTATWNNQKWPQWPGIVLIQPQLMTTGATLTCSTLSTVLAPNGEYSFSFTITNSGPDDGWFNLYIEGNL